MQCTAMTHSQTILAVEVPILPCVRASSLTQSPHRKAAGHSETSPAVVLRTLRCARPACAARRLSHRSRCCAPEPHRCPSTSMLGQGWPPVPWDGWCAGLRSRCCMLVAWCCRAKARIKQWTIVTLGYADTCLSTGCMQGHRQGHEPAPGCDSVARLWQRAALCKNQRHDRSGVRTDPAGAVGAA